MYWFWKFLRLKTIVSEEFRESGCHLGIKPLEGSTVPINALLLIASKVTKEVFRSLTYRKSTLWNYLSTSTSPAFKTLAT